MTDKKTRFEERIEQPYDLDKLLAEMADTVNELGHNPYDVALALMIGRASVAIQRLRGEK